MWKWSCYLWSLQALGSHGSHWLAPADSQLFSTKQKYVFSFLSFGPFSSLHLLSSSTPLLLNLCLRIVIGWCCWKLLKSFVKIWQSVDTLSGAGAQEPQMVVRPNSSRGRRKLANSFLLAWRRVLEQVFQLFHIVSHIENDCICMTGYSQALPGSLRGWGGGGQQFQHICNLFLAHWLESFALEKKNILLFV